jgi:hypothetical protein
MEAEGQYSVLLDVDGFLDLGALARHERLSGSVGMPTMQLRDAVHDRARDRRRGRIASGV